MNQDLPPPRAPGGVIHTAPGVPPLSERPLYVYQFAGGGVGITCRGMALHLRENDARELTRRLIALFGVQP